MTTEELRLWNERFNRARSLQMKLHPIWQQSLDLYRMRFFNKQGIWSPQDDELTAVNFATTFIKRMLQATYARNPKMYIEARRPQYVPFAETLEISVNYFWEDLDMKNEVLRAYRDALITGIGWMELGWTDSFTKPTTPMVTPDQPEKPLIDRLKHLLKPNGKPEPSGAAQGELHELVQPGQPFARHRSSWHVFFPEGFHDYYEMPYLFMTERLRAEDFLNNPRYGEKDKIVTTARTTPSGKVMQTAEYSSQQGPYRYTAATGGFNDTQTIELVHLWDRLEDRYAVFSMQATHLETEWPYYPDGFPLIPLTFNDIPADLKEAHAYPFGDLEPIFGQLIEKTSCRRQMAAHRKRISSIVGVRKASSTESEVRNYTEGQPVMVIPLTDPSSVVPFPEIPIPHGIWDVEGSVDSDLERETALNLLIASISSSKTVDTATLANALQGAANLETGFRVERLEDFSKKLSRYLGGLIWQKASKTQIGEILGTLPTAEQWISLQDLPPEQAKQRIKRELLWRVDAGSTKPMTDDAVRREQKIRAVAVLQSTSPQLFQQVARPIFADLVKDLGFKEIEQIVRNSLDEESMNAAMQENQLMMQGHPQTVDPFNDHASHIRAHQQAAGNALVDQHILEHAAMLQGTTANQKTSGQGTRQRADAPSGAEVMRMGTPATNDIAGRTFNMGRGTGAEVPTR